MSMPYELTRSSSYTAAKDDVLLFETAWEVAKRVGGIYTVLKSKAEATMQEFGDRYTAIGPLQGNVSYMTEFELLEPTSPLFRKAVSALEQKHGIKAHVGRWLVAGYPRCILLDVNQARHRVGEFKWELGIPDYHNDGETDEVVVFGYMCARLLEEVSLAAKELRIVAHFHEWNAGVGLILLRKWNVRCATVFTTHATLLARYLSAAREDFYNNIQHYDYDREAGIRGIYQRVWIERGAAHGAHVFTTVSDITGFEAEHVLGKKPDMLTPNGLQVEKFEAVHEFQNLHFKFKQIIHEFVKGHFYGYYDFDLDKTLYFFTSGRYEVYNKGIDMYIDSLARLNQLLKQDGSPITVIAFIITNARTHSYNIDSLKGQTFMKDLRNTTNTLVQQMNDKIFEATAKGELIKPEQLLTQADIVKLKARIVALKQRQSLPPIVTHNMVDDGDEILGLIRRAQLFNHPSDRVKIVYHPEFLHQLNPLLPLDYTDFVRGSNLGIFPSYYEPWGYTPAECTVMGVPSITTNLTGFANFMTKRLDEPEKHGLFVVNRRTKPYHEAMTQLTNMMWRFCMLDRRQRIELRNRTEKLGELFSWTVLHEYYSNARNTALKRAYQAFSGYGVSEFKRAESLAQLLGWGAPSQTDMGGGVKADINSIMSSRPAKVIPIISDERVDLTGTKVAGIQLEENLAAKNALVSPTSSVGNTTASTPASAPFDPPGKGSVEKPK